MRALKARKLRLAARSVKQERRITLDRGDYFELSAITDRARKLELEALRMAVEAQQSINGLRARGNVILARLGKEHGFNPVNTFTLEDDGCVLVLTDAEKNGGS